MIFPSPLKAGDTIAIVAPSGGITCRASFEEGIRILHEFGFKTKFPRDLWPGREYLADTDENRSNELKTIWNDPEVDAVMAARGGFGCLRITAQLQSTTFFPQPKRFIGFSDITLLHSFLNEKHNLVTLHGPVVTSLSRLNQKSLLAFRSALIERFDNWQCSFQPEILRDSHSCSGISAGGNLSTIISTLGTVCEQDWKNKIVILEDTGEPLYRIDRMLTQLKLCGKLDTVSAILLGDFSHGLGLDRIETMRHHDAIWERMLDLTDENVTLWADVPVGHGATNFTLPLGMKITLDSMKGVVAHR
ncbi:MAG: LD-carboxypeptidase [Desulfopila sp.]|jgi:muramoyltetrapeptide carboxypeptidase|nr:LD-carboxypeptidase [Desulfopila sp.]